MSPVGGVSASGPASEPAGGPDSGPTVGDDPLLHGLGLEPFRPRAPWWGADLQTLRDTLRQRTLAPDQGETHQLPVGGGDRLLVRLDRPEGSPGGLALLVHGLGGSSEGEGVGRLADTLRRSGLAVARLNLRGAGLGRPLARGTYAAIGNRDLAPVLAWARQQAGALGPPGGPPLPLLGAGISMGGTLLLNAVLDPQLRAVQAPAGRPLLDALVTLSSPLDLLGAALRIERPRNRLYVSWLMRGLRRQTLADPFGVTQAEHSALAAARTIRDFDAAITAPRWGFDGLDHYYAAASPLERLRAELAAGAQRLPPTLMVHALDDPWVPVAPARELAAVVSNGPAAPLTVVLTRSGGHNGFHAPGGCWSDRLVARWLGRLVQTSLC